MHTNHFQPVSYQGPRWLDSDVSLALEVLSQCVTFSTEESLHHQVILANGFEQEDRAVQALSIYLVGAIASCIQFNLDVRAALFDEHCISRELYDDVVRVVGADNCISDDRKVHERDPWIWEGISHLILHLSVFDSSSHPPAPVLAKNLLKLSVKDHGLDIVALYGTGPLGVTAGECKAYLLHPGRAIAAASDQLQEIDNKLRDAEIRQTLSQFMPVLSESEKDMLATTFWRNERAYFPMICCEASAAVDWSQSRRAIERLEPPASRIFLVPLAIENADAFFDTVADAMRGYARMSEGGSCV